MKEERLRSIIEGQVKEVLEEMIFGERNTDEGFDSTPDERYTYWTKSDTDWLEGFGFEYDEDDDSYSKDCGRNRIIHVQKTKRSKYSIKVIDYSKGKAKIPYSKYDETRDGMISCVRFAMRLCSDF